MKAALLERSAAAAFRLRLLGGFALHDQAGRELTVPSRKGQALLAILALAEGRPLSRECLIARLWSDRGEQQARSSLRQALTELRRSLSDPDAPLLSADRQAVLIDPAAFETDVLVFRRLVREGSRASLAAAAALYRGDLLEGLEIRDEGFETWRRTERQRLLDQAGEAFRRLLSLQEGAEAIATAQRLLRLDPLDEAAHRALMRLLAAAGDRSAAIRQYETCRRLLEAELQLKPDGETDRLLAQIRQGRAAPEPAPEPAASPAPSAPAAEAPAHPPPPDRPSIAVLPFTNLSGDPEQAHVANGIAEDIVTALSKIPGLLVVARRSTAVYESADFDVAQVAREQGVSHLLAGSVRKNGARIRVTAQLVEAASGGHQWAERYDRTLDDIFEVQDDIAKQVTSELQVRLSRGEEARVWARGTGNIEAWEMVARAMPLSDDHIKGHNGEAQCLAAAALRLDPDYASAWVILGWTHWEDSLWGWSASQAASLETARTCAERALALDPESPEALMLRATIRMADGETAEAVALSRKAVALAPGHANNLALAAMTLIFAGEPDCGEALMRRAMRHSPIYPQWYRMMLGVVRHMAGDHARAVEVFRACMAREPETDLHRLWLIAALVAAGRAAEARRLAAEVLAADPDFRAAPWAAGFNAAPALTGELVANLTKAGLPA